MSARDMWGRVLESAVHVAVHGISESEARDLIHTEEALTEEWLWSDSEAPGSFLWVCEVLEVNPHELRRRIRISRAERRTARQ